MAKQDYYQTLHVKRDASDKEIKQAYRRLVSIIRTSTPETLPRSRNSRKSPRRTRC